MPNAMKTEKASAQSMAEEVLALRGHPGFIWLLKLYRGEIEKVEEWVSNVDRSITDPHDVAQELRYRQGMRDGVLRFMHWIEQDLPEHLRQGRVPDYSEKER